MTYLFIQIININLYAYINLYKYISVCVLVYVQQFICVCFPQTFRQCIPQYNSIKELSGMCVCIQLLKIVLNFK